MEIIVNYEEASKNGDMSALTCFKPKNKYAFDMVVSAVSNEADEIFKIVSKQGYLKEHDSKLLDKVAEKFHGRIRLRELTRQETMDIFDEVIEELKAEVSENIV